MNDLTGKKVVVSGGSKGIGKAIAKDLLLRGAKVLIFSRSKENLNKAYQELKDKGMLYTQRGDASSIKDVKKIFKFADEELGGIDILINNAALAAGSLESMKIEDIKYIIETNYFGYLNCAKEALLRMKKQKSGHILNIGSLSAKTLDAGSSIYNSTKTGIWGFNETLRKEVSKYNIKVTLIEYGAVSTDIHGISEKELERAVKNKQMITVEHASQAVIYALSSDLEVDNFYIASKPRKQEI